MMVLAIFKSPDFQSISSPYSDGFSSANHGGIRREADCDADFGSPYEALADMRGHRPQCRNPFLARL
jgi:hypothetical protein